MGSNETQKYGLFQWVILYRKMNTEKAVGGNVALS